MGVRTGHAIVNGADLQYETSGRGPAVVLLHGGLCHLRQWDDLAPRLGVDHQVLRYDRRGHGRSSFPDVPYAHHDDLAALLDALGVTSAHLVAVSAGVGVAVDFTLSRPQAVRSLVLGSGTMGGYRHSAEFNSGITEIVKTGARGDKQRAGDLLAVFPPLRVAVTMPDVWPNVRRMMIDEYTFAQSRDEAPRPVAMDPSATERIGEIAAPTLVIVGDAEMDSMVEHARFLARGIRGAELRVIPKAGHMVTFEQPAEFARVVTEFLGRQ